MQQVVAMLDVGFKEFDAGAGKLGDANLTTLFRTFLGRDDHPDQAHVVADLPRVAAVLRRIAADVDELTRARRVADLGAAALPDRRAGRRRRVAEPDLDLRESAAAASGLSLSAPGTCSPLNASSAAKPTSRLMRRATHSGIANRGRAHDPLPIGQRCSAT